MTSRQRTQLTAQELCSVSIPCPTTSVERRTRRIQVEHNVVATVAVAHRLCLERQLLYCKGQGASRLQLSYFVFDGGANEPELSRRTIPFPDLGSGNAAWGGGRRKLLHVMADLIRRPQGGTLWQFARHAYTIPRYLGNLQQQASKLCHSYRQLCPPWKLTLSAKR